MSTFAAGKRYSLRYGEPRRDVECVRRHFEGALELVDLAHVQPVDVGGGALAMGLGVPWTRTARTFGCLVIPEVTDTLGGVYREGACLDHGKRGTALAHGGPHDGILCCSLCGGPVAG